MVSQQMGSIKRGVPGMHECIPEKRDRVWLVFMLDGERIIGGLGVIENDFMTGKTLLQMFALYIRKKRIVARE